MSQVEGAVTSSSKEKRQYRKGNPIQQQKGSWRRLHVNVKRTKN
ncbi:hypothetical protein AHX56_25100 [Salmonella enterica subsp. enterica]|nr:hypothetical protein [Salmonella enterica subsp. enterica]